METLIYFVFKIAGLVYSKVATHYLMGTGIGHAKNQPPASFIGQSNNIS